MVWIIYSKEVLSDNRPNALSWMMEEANNLGLEAEIMFAEDFQLIIDKGMYVLYKNKEIDLPQGAFIRCYDTNLVEFLESLGVKTFNSSQGLIKSRNKWASHKALSAQAINSPKTILCSQDSTYNQLVSELESPFILKDSFGTHGDQVYLIKSITDYQTHITSCRLAIAQKFIKSSYGKDLRVHVIDNEVVACVLRHSDDSFLSNFAQGGKAKAFIIDKEAKELAIKASKALGLNFSGVDLLFDHEGYTVCEVNGIPGFRTIGLTSKENLPNMMLSYIKEQLCKDG